jgi:hypothetical protein
VARRAWCAEHSHCRSVRPEARAMRGSQGGREWVSDPARCGRACWSGGPCLEVVVYAGRWDAAAAAGQQNNLADFV